MQMLHNASVVESHDKLEVVTDLFFCIVTYIQVKWIIVKRKNSSLSIHC